jgi:hypothetical protein
MASERRRAREARRTSGGRPRSYSDLYKNDSSGAAAVAAVTTDAPAEPVVQRNWQDEYVYVTQDLRRLLIVSAALFAAIIAAGFFL